MTKQRITFGGKMLLAAATLSLLGTAAPLPARAQQVVAPATVPTIHVSGTGEVTVTPDIARVTVGVYTRGKDATQTAEENARKTAAVIQAIRASGVAEKDIQTAEYRATPQLDYQKQPPVLVQYEVSNSVRVTVRKIGDVGKILDAALKAGANNADGIVFDIGDPQKARDEALLKAVADATRKATLIWKAIPIDDGIRKTNPIHLMELTEGSSGGFPPPMPLARTAMVESAVATPIQAGEIKIVVTLSARFVYRDGN